LLPTLFPPHCKHRRGPLNQFKTVRICLFAISSPRLPFVRHSFNEQSSFSLPLMFPHSGNLPLDHTRIWPRSRPSARENCRPAWPARPSKAKQQQDVKSSQDEIGEALRQCSGRERLAWRACQGRQMTNINI
jgi:hypothetical protein